MMYTKSQLEQMVIECHPIVSLAILSATNDNKEKMKKKLFEFVAPCIDEVNDLTEESIVSGQRILMKIFKREGWL